MNAFCGVQLELKIFTSSGVDRQVMDLGQLTFALWQFWSCLSFRKGERSSVQYVDSGVCCKFMGVCEFCLGIHPPMYSLFFFNEIMRRRKLSYVSEKKMVELFFFLRSNPEICGTLPVLLSTFHYDVQLFKKADSFPLVAYTLVSSLLLVNQPMLA